jgi:hypothetical protein
VAVGADWGYDTGFMPGNHNAFLAEAAEAARGQFGGPLSYASGTWEPVDWSRFDIVGVDAYRDARNTGSFRADLRKRFTHPDLRAKQRFTGKCVLIARSLLRRPGMMTW